MARDTTLVKLLDLLRVEARLSLNPAHNAQDRSSQVTLLQAEQERLWEDFDWPHLRVKRNTAMQAGQRYYSMPDDIQVDRLEKLQIFTNGRWFDLLPGIEAAEYAAYNSDLDQRAYPPRRWQLYEDGTIEVWPISNIDGDLTTLEGCLRFVGIRNLNPLVADADRADLDDRMLALYVAAKKLAASGAKDAKLKLEEANARYARLRGRLTPRRTFTPFGGDQPAPSHRIFITNYRPAGS